MRVAAYTRVSTEEQVQGYSLEGQQNEIARLCEKKAWSLVQQFTDPGLSGSLPPAQLVPDGGVFRKGLSNLIDGAQAGQFDLVLVVNIDRLSRDLADMWPVIRMLRVAKVGVATTQIPELTSLSKEFYLTYGGMAGMTQYMRELIHENQARGFAVAKAKGKHLGRIPRGFTLGSDGYLHPDELGKKAMDILKTAPKMKLGTMASLLGLNSENEAFKLKQAVLKHGGLST